MVWRRWSLWWLKSHQLQLLNMQPKSSSQASRQWMRAWVQLIASGKRGSWMTLSQTLLRAPERSKSPESQRLCPRLQMESSQDERYRSPFRRVSDLQFPWSKVRSTLGILLGPNSCSRAQSSSMFGGNPIHKHIPIRRMSVERSNRINLSHKTMTGTTKMDPAHDTKSARFSKWC